MDRDQTIAKMRSRPGMYLGDFADGPLHMATEVIGNSIDQYLAGRCSRLTVDVAADGEIAVEDDGPGFLVEGGAGMPSLADVLRLPSDRPTVDGHRPHVHLGSPGLGLFVVAVFSERFELTTIRDGVEARAVLSRGALIEPVTAHPTHRRPGTLVRFRVDRAIIPHPHVSRAELASKLEDLAYLAPGLDLRWSIGGDADAVHGLAACVAHQASCRLDRVAHHRGTYDTEKGPVQVEVALAWKRYGERSLTSFVNLLRTREHGSHVDGLLEALRAYTGRTPREREAERLVAAVAVVLSDVIWGAPFKTRLDNPEAREPVAAATRAALDAWAAANPE